MPKQRVHNFDFSSEGSHVALVSKTLQGGPANGRETLIWKAAGDVTVTMSFAEFLRKFFNIWWEDSMFLAELLGFGDLENEPEWIREEIEEKMSAISIMKQANNAENLEEFVKSLDESEVLQILQVQQAFEKAYKASSGKKTKQKKKETEEVSKSNSSVSEDAKNNEENDYMDTKDILKSAEFQEMLSAEIEKARIEEREQVKADLEKANSKIADLEKAKQEIEKSKYVELVKGYSFADSEKAEELAVVLMKAASVEGGDLLLETLEKARTAIAEFAETQHGEAGEGESVTEVEKSKSRVSEFLKARKAK